MAKLPRRVRIFEVGRGPYKLIVGIDFDNPKASNVMGYIRSGKFYGAKETEKYPEFWLSISELDKLGMLLLLFARFWAKKRDKGVSREEVEAFRKFWEGFQSQWPSIGPYEEEEGDEEEE